MSVKGELSKLHTLALQALRNGVIIADAEGKILWVNRAVNRITGYNASELVGSRFEVLEPGDMKTQFNEVWLKAKKGTPWTGEYVIQRKSGESYYEELTINPINEGGKVTYYIIIKRDVSARKSIEENLKIALQNLENQYTEAERARSETAAILDATTEAMLLLSLDNRFRWVNQRFEEFFILREEEALGHTFAELLEHFKKVFNDPQGIIDRFNQAFSDGNYSYSEFVSQNWPLKRDLEIYSSQVLDAAGLMIGTLFVFRDVTKEREVERLKSEFISLVSHELRTPLSSLSGYMDMILDGDAGEINDEQRDYLKVAKRNSDKLTKLVADLLTVSRIEAGAIELNRKPLQLADIVRDTVDNLRPQFNIKNQRITLETLEEDTGVNGDAERLGQVFTNLLSNAQKYTPSEGRITVKLSVEGHRIRADVQDTGIGLTPYDLQKLFTKFFRSRDSEAQQITGVGLGLWITRSLVDMHGGEITVSSEYGKGSTFTVFLPRE
ncbi:PAS domain S-box protein [Candidatus Bathyarchaeota archaeon]|nr:PAS domain S-box protein [Candidatus Bathyarchaeota archaeon]